MGIRTFQCFIFLLGLFFCSGTLIRISYDGSSLPSPAELLQFVKQNDSPHIKISDKNHAILRTVCRSSIDLDLYMSMKNILAVSKSRDLAVTWVQREVSSFFYCMNISTIIVSSELMTGSHFPTLLPALKTISAALKSLKLDLSTKLSASFPLSFIEECFSIPSKPPSPKSDFLQVMDFLQEHKSCLTVTAFCGKTLSFRDCLINVTNRALSVLPNHDIPLRINLRNTRLPSLIDRVEVDDKLMSLIGKNYHARQLSFFVEKPLVVEVEQKELKQENLLQSHQRELIGSKVKSANITPQLDVITPLATVPVINPTTATVVNPIVSPAAPKTTPPTSPSTTPMTTSTVSPSQSWCIASQTASPEALQVALDFACGYGGADCSVIQKGGSCYEPNTARDHASYAFNDYYQKNPVATSCNFGGTAVLTNIDPSISTCQYASTSTSSSVLNTTNPTGVTVFISGPSGPTSAASVPSNFAILCTLAYHLMLMIIVNHL